MDALLRFSVLAIDSTTVTAADGYRVTNFVSVDQNGAVAPIGHFLSLRTTSKVYIKGFEELFAWIKKLYDDGFIKEMPGIMYILMDGCRACK